MNSEQTYEQNRAAFIARLIEAGWTKEQAEAEWTRIIADEESDL
jgi:hypothetical protein